MSRKYSFDVPDALAKKVRGRAKDGFHSVELTENEWEQLLDSIDAATVIEDEEQSFIDAFVSPVASELLKFAKENSILMAEIFKASIKHTTK